MGPTMSKGFKCKVLGYSIIGLQKTRRPGGGLALPRLATACSEVRMGVAVVGQDSVRLGLQLKS